MALALKGGGNAVSQNDCCKQGGRSNHLDAKIRVSNVITLYFKNGFARNSVENYF
jgi:hypothetical protein